MNLIRRNSTPATNYWPNRIDDRFGRLVEAMFEDMVAPLAQGASMLSWTGENSIAPRLHVTETEKTYEIEAEMPSVKKEDVKVAVDHQRVTIEGECHYDNAQGDNAQGNGGANVLYSERRAQRFMRSFTLPTDVDDSNAQAHMENGVLSLSLPKKQDAAPKRLTIS